MRAKSDLANYESQLSLEDVKSWAMLHGNSQITITVNGICIYNVIITEWKKGEWDLRIKSKWGKITAREARANTST